MEVILKHPVVLKGEKEAQSMEHTIRLRSLTFHTFKKMHQNPEGLVSGGKEE